MLNFHAGRSRGAAALYPGVESSTGRNFAGGERFTARRVKRARRVRRLCNRGSILGNRQLFPAKSPKELLAEFKETGANAPFEEIVRRYAAMVYGVCLRVTGDKHDAEDATQAVFLSLALQAKTSREIKYIGPWLQKVAHRLALDVKKSKTRRKKREEKLADDTRHAGANGNGHSNGNGGHHPAFTGGNGHRINP